MERKGILQNHLDSKQVTGMKEGTCRDERGVMDGSVESLNATPETKFTLSVNYLEFQ